MRRPCISVPAWMLAAVASAAFVLAGCSDDGTGEPEPGVWVARVAPFVPDEGQRLAPVQVVDLVSGKARTFGPADRYSEVAWSPDGRRLAAISYNAFEGKGPRLRVWDHDGTVMASHEFGADGYGVLSLAWSPDSTRLLARLVDGVAIYDDNGRHVGTAMGTPLPGGTHGLSSQ